MPLSRPPQTVGSVMNRNRRSLSTGNNYSFPEDIGAHGLMMIFRKYRFVIPGQRGFSNQSSSQSDIRDSILLPLPANIADSYSMRIGRPELGIVNEAIATAASAAAANKTGLASSIYGALTNLGLQKHEAQQMISGEGDEGIGRMVQNAKYLVRSSLPSGISTAIDQGLGAMINPKMSLSFDGLDLKTHAFDWTLMPRSPEESDTLKDIIQAIKRNIHPSYASVDGYQRSMLEYPSTVDLFFVGLKQEYYFHFKTCMVQAFSNNYSPSGNAILEGGKPAALQMSLQFVETDIHTAEDYGGESGRNFRSSEIDIPSSGTNAPPPDREGIGPQ